MIIEILKNISNSNYPSNISELSELEKYNESYEHKNLCKTLIFFENKHRNEGCFTELIEDFKAINLNMNFHDATLFSSCDRAFNLQLTKMNDKNLHSICLNISVLCPYFTCYVLDAKVDLSLGKWIEKPYKNENLEVLYADEIHKINELVEKKYQISKFPTELLNYKLPQISRGFIPFGDFTFFNAFFLDEYYTRL
ncbi:MULTISPECIES: hypothetical protein [Flavobacterium]|uniref:Uncharacterized protein n=1 Tax=Flavobacterium panici TaxID=2654843 RepID=A0A9N8J1G9_9FLAO|nr:MULTISPECIES: hypothetical protein [Flavobacterium]UUF12355.1 hypothetical protein NLJ00_13950 [Flavobacterium panici]CAC9974347.1 hypothetical protein FLAPXU55_02044 [Flavobacterium panici]